MALQLKFTDFNKNKVNFGIFHGWTITNFIARFVDKFRKEYPNFEVFANSGDSINLLSGLKSGKFNFVIGVKELFSSQEADITKIIMEDLYESHRIVAFSRNNPLAKKQNLKLEDFASQSYYAFYQEKQPMELLTNKKLFAKYGFEPKVKLMDNIYSVIMAMNSGEGYAILDEYQGIVYNTNFKYLVLPETVMVTMAYTKESVNDTLQMKFIKELIKNFRKYKHTIKNA